MSALLEDLAQRGMLEDTLLLWGGEFGRTPMGQGSGRDHHILGFSVFLAGGGVKKGHIYGETDEFAWNITKDPMHVHDMQATLMHLFGINHEALTFRYQGRQFRLTDVHGKVAKGILA